MRVLASLSTVAVTTVILASCGLDMGGLGEVAGTEGGPTLDSSMTAEGGSSSGSSSGSGDDSSSGGDDGSTDGTMGGGDSSSSSSGGADSTAPQDSSMADSSSPVDSSIPDTYVADTYVVETAPACTTANNCYVIPTSWQLVAFTTGASAPTAGCPSGFAMTQPTNLDEGPITSSTCACGACSISTQPTCPTGPIAVSYDIGGDQCGTTGTPSTQKNANVGTCNTDMYTGNFPGIAYSNMDLKYTPPTATGGQCASPGTASGAITYTAQDRTCVPDSQASAGCSGSQCTLTLAAPYEVCVFQSGSQTCPAGQFSHQHLAGSSATVTCSSCGCNLTTSCTGTMKLFTSNDCTTTGGAKEDDIAADGACHSANTQTGQYNSYEYAPKAPAASCAASGTSTAQNVTLANEETICCTQ